MKWYVWKWFVNGQGLNRSKAECPCPCSVWVQKVGLWEVSGWGRVVFCWVSEYGP